MKPIRITLLCFSFLCFFHITSLLGYDVTDPNTFSLTTTFGNVGSDTEGRAYAIALAPVTAQSYLNLLNAVCTKSDPHNLYTAVMAAPPMNYSQKIPLDPIQKKTDWSTFPTSSTYSLTGTNPNLPAIGISLVRAGRWINWCNNGQQSDPATTESGTYIISENSSNPAPPGNTSYQCITLDSNSISQAIVSDHIARLADPTKPPLTMVFLASEPVLYTFHSDESDAYVPMGSDDTRTSFSYFWEWTSTLDNTGMRKPYSFYGEYELLQGTTLQARFPFDTTDSYYYETGFRLMKVTFPTGAYSTDMPAGPPLPLQISQ